MADPDIYWHLRDAQFMATGHRWIRHDMFAYTTAGMPWIDHEWLAELPFYAAFHLGGTHGLFWLTTALLGLIFAGVYLLARKSSGSPLAAWIVTVAAIVLGTVSYGPRTLLFGWICLVLLLLLLARFEKSRKAGDAIAEKRTLWLIPPLFALWINLHGSWLIGLTLLAVYVGCGLFEVHLGAIHGRRWRAEERRLLLVLLGCSMAALFLNPYGWRLTAYPFDLAFNQKLNIAHVEEWQALDSHTIRARVFFALLGGGFVAQLVRRRAWAPYQLAFCFTGIYAALLHTRFLFLAAILSLPLFAEDLAWEPHPPARKDKSLLRLSLLGLAVVSTIRISQSRMAVVSETAGYPTQALPFLRSFHPQGPVLNDYLWGGYLELYAPNIPIFIDSRVDIFERRGIFRDYLEILEMKNTLAILERDRIRYVLFTRDSPLAYFLKQLPAWKIDYEDGTTVLLERIGSPSALVHAAK